MAITVSGSGNFDGKSIGIAMGIPRIGKLGGAITVSGEWVDLLQNL